MINKHLLITPAHKVQEWKGIVEKVLDSGRDIIVIGDTETTGGIRKGKGASVREKEDPEYLGRMHRIVELGFIICVRDEKTGQVVNLKDSDGESIFFHEYLNFMDEDKSRLNKYNSMREMPYGPLKVHGISLEFLKGNECLGESFAKQLNEQYNVPLPSNYKKTLKLERSAPTFAQVIDSLLDICGLNKKTQGVVYFVAHNFEFDAKFLNAEMKNAGKPIWEALIRPIDTLILATGLFTSNYIKTFKENKRLELRSKLASEGKSEHDIKIIVDKKIPPKGIHSLDTLCYVMTERMLMNLDGVNRELHGAALDSEILKRLYIAMISSDEYKNAPNTPNLNMSKISDKVNDFLTKVGNDNGGGVRVRPIPLPTVKVSQFNSIKGISNK